MTNLCRWQERLSLDAVIVAAVWGLALGVAAGRPMGTGTAVVLALATWLVYVADRLRDTGPGRVTPKTDRHLYYDRHYKEITLAWLGVLAAALVLAVVVLPPWKLLWGWLLVLGVVWYLWKLGKPLNAAQRLLLKRTAVPLIFTLGVGWMAECWRSGPGLLAAAILLAGSAANVLLISYRENRDTGAPGWLPKALGASLLALVALGNLGLWYHLPAGSGALLCAGVYFVLMIRIQAGGGAQVRAWADGALAAAGLALMVL
jgi:hypothetical protein